MILNIVLGMITFFLSGSDIAAFHLGSAHDWPTLRRVIGGSLPANKQFENNALGHFTAIVMQLNF